MNAKVRNLPAWLLSIALSVALAIPVHAAAHDLLIVVDNSGSMRANDPQFLARTAVERVAGDSGPDVRVGIVLFDGTPRLVVPLSDAGEESRRRIRAALEDLDYSGQWTDIPAAIELALYHLREQGRSGVPHNILFITDGIVDTGDAARDIDRERWLLETLAPLAAENDVRIFGIAFSEAADFRLIQSLARQTDAEYLRAYTADALLAAFASLHRALARPPVQPEPEPEPEPEPVVSIPQPRPEPVPAVDTARTGNGETGRPASSAFIWLALSLALAAAAGGGYWFLRNRSRGGPVEAEIPGAMLHDRTGVTGQPRHTLLTAVTVIGRHPAPGPEIATSVQIERNTVSRKHAEIRWRDGRYWVEEYGAPNGTFVNGERLHGMAPLNDGDTLRVDTFEFEFRELHTDHTQVREAPDDDGCDRTLVRGQVEDDEDAERTNFNISKKPADPS